MRRTHSGPSAFASRVQQLPLWPAAVLAAVFAVAVAAAVAVAVAVTVGVAVAVAMAAKDAKLTLKLHTSFAVSWLVAASSRVPSAEVPCTDMKAGCLVTGALLRHNITQDTVLYSTAVLHSTP